MQGPGKCSLCLNPGEKWFGWPSSQSLPREWSKWVSSLKMGQLFWGLATRYWRESLAHRTEVVRDASRFPKPSWILVFRGASQPIHLPVRVENDHLCSMCEIWMRLFKARGESSRALASPGATWPLWRLRRNMTWRPVCNIGVSWRSGGGVVVQRTKQVTHSRSVFCGDQNLLLPSWAKTHRRGTRDYKNLGKQNCREGSEDAQVLGPQTLPSSGSHIQNGRVPPGEQD